jgi:bifunctional UDP-N-acetylglucosamine pyrophosphorylase / glucosamine-1-phosphate N-acetyltransferase
MSKLNIVVLAAGKGSRMTSNHPKVLHRLAGRSLIEFVVAKAEELKPTKIIIVHGHQSDLVREAMSDFPQLHWVKQTQQLGTGHALQQALPIIEQDAQVLVLSGDVPLIQTKTLQKLHDAAPPQALGLITARVSDPAGLGRVIRNEDQTIERIVEHKDASKEQLALHEIYSGIMLVNAQHLMEWLPQLTNNNMQEEFYLTQVIQLAVQTGVAIRSVQPEFEQEIHGVNTRNQLIALERFYQYRQAEYWLSQGVTIMDPHRFDVRGELQCGTDVTIDINNIFSGKVSIGNNCQIGSNCILTDVVLGDNVTVKANSILEQATVDSDCIVGPFARLRPETTLAERVHIGNFVEIKRSIIGVGSKVNHLSYIGDTTIGCGVNIGAGTITCNYDGVDKHQTRIEDGAFIGSGTELVAPVTIGHHATIGAGSTIREDVPAEELTLSVSRQQTIHGWQRKHKSSTKEES